MTSDACRLVDLYLDRADVGSGWRRYVVTQVGTKWVHLLYIPHLRHLKLPVLILRRARRDVSSDPKRVRAAIREARRSGVHDLAPAKTDAFLKSLKENTQ